MLNCPYERYTGYFTTKCTCISGWIAIASKQDDMVVAVVPINWKSQKFSLKYYLTKNMYCEHDWKHGFWQKKKKKTDSRKNWFQLSSVVFTWK